MEYRSVFLSEVLLLLLDGHNFRRVSVPCHESHIVNCLRFQEIAGSLDSVLTSSSLVPVQNLDPGESNNQYLTLTQSVTLLESLKSCWREDVLVLSCSDKFLRLCLQLLARSV